MGIFTGKEGIKQRDKKQDIFFPLQEEALKTISEYAEDESANPLTRKLYNIPELRPSRFVNVEGKTFLVGSVIKTRLRYQTIFYVVRKDKRGNKTLLPRVAYRSMSAGGWRVCPRLETIIEGKKSRTFYSKGKHIHYTQETKPHEDLIKYFEWATQNDVVQKNVDLIDLFDATKGDSSWDTYNSEVRMFRDRGRIFDNFSRLRPYTYEEGVYLPGLDIAQKSKELSSSREFVQYIPDFSQTPIKKWKQTHSLLGVVTMESYQTLVDNRKVEWVMAYDEEGRVWIESIHLADSPINSYGIRSEVINSGVLTNKPLEYAKAVTALKAEQAIPFDKNHMYKDITPFLDNLYPIKLFRAVKKITRKDRHEKVKGNSNIQARTFSLRNILLGAR